MRIEELPVAEFGFPGELRDRLVAAILAGAKTSTSSLLADYSVEPEPLPTVGDLAAVVDSTGERVAVIETTEVRVVAAADVDDAHAADEGEGTATAAAWRRAHEEFWHGDEYRTWRGDPGFELRDDEPVVLQRFRLLATAGRR